MGSSSDDSDSEINKYTENRREVQLEIENPDQVQIKYHGKTMSLSKMLNEKDELRRAFSEETKRLERIVIDRVKRVSEQEVMLENKKRRLDIRSKELDKREALIEYEEKKLNDLRNYEEQMEARDEDLQNQYDEKQKARKDRQKKSEELKRKLDAVRKKYHKTESSEYDDSKLKVPKVKIETTKRVGGDDDGDDVAIQQKIDGMPKAWQEAFKKLVVGLSILLNRSHGKIWINRMSGVDEKASKNACIRFPLERSIEDVEVCSLWQEKLKNPEWYPFKIVEDENGNSQILVNKDDALLRGIKEEWGDKAYDASITALKLLQKHKTSGCYVVPELWYRGPMLEDVIIHIIVQLKTFKPITT